MNYGPFEGFCNFEQVLRHRHRHRLRLVIDANVLNKRIIIIITPKSFISAQDAQTTNLAGHRTAGGGRCNGTRSGPNRCNDTCQNIPFCSTFGFTIAKITIRQFFFLVVRLGCRHINYFSRVFKCLSFRLFLFIFCFSHPLLTN